MFVIKEDGEMKNQKTGQLIPYTCYFQHDAGFCLGWTNEASKAKKFDTRARAVKFARKLGLYARNDSMIEIEKVT